MRAIFYLASVAVTLSACGESKPTNAAYRLEITTCTENAIGFATAVAVDEHLLATAAHPLTEAQSVLAFSADGDALAGDVVYIDQAKDLALVRLSSAVPLFLPLGEAETGATVLLGTFEDGVYTPRQGTIIRQVEVTLDGANERLGLELVATITPGDSGAGVIVDGKVVGIVFARSDVASTTAWAVDASELAAAQAVFAAGVEVPPRPTC